MKTTLILATATLATLFSLASAQPPDRPQRGGKEGRPTPAEIAANLSERYAALAVFDKDKTGTLDETEQASVATAIEDGSLEIAPPGGPSHRGGKDRPDQRPDGGKSPDNEKPGKPPGAMIAGHAAKLYASLAVYDTDKAGGLDATEQAAVAKAIEDGTLKLPRPGGPRGDRPEGGPRGPRPDGQDRGPRGPRPAAE